MSYALPDEMELLQQLIAGDAESFRKIYEFYQGRIFLFAFRLTKSKSSAEEIVQEVFIKVWEKRELLKMDRSFHNYLLVMTKNLVINKLRKAASDKAVQERIYKNMQALQDKSVDEVIQNEIQKLYRQAVDRLSPQKKIVFMMSREEELSYEEIADRLGVSKNTVRNQMSDALKSIREFLSSHPDIGCVILASMMLHELV